MENSMKVLGASSVLTFVLAAAAGGCSARHAEDRVKIVPVRGVVRLNGKPVDGARVDFHNASSDKPSAYATTDSEGKFTLTTYENGDGATPGKYRVAVTKAQEAGRHEQKTAPPIFRGGGGAPKPKWLIPQQYSNPNTSNLTHDIVDGENPEIVLDLKG
jgi:hypothetical protein